MLIKRKRLQLKIEPEKWFREIASLPFIQFVPVNNNIAADSVNLPGKFHSDPADRIIVATAREKDAVLITSDKKIRKYPGVKSVW